MIVSPDIDRVSKMLGKVKEFPKKVWEHESLSIRTLKPEMILEAKTILESDLLGTDGFGGKEVQARVDMMIAILLGTFKASRVLNTMEFELKGITVDGLIRGGDDDLSFDDVSGDPNWEIEVIDQIIEWVAEYKNLEQGRDTGRDGKYLPHEDIAWRLVHTIKRDPDAFFRQNEDGKGVLDPDGLVRQTGLVPLEPTMLSLRLDEILRMWAELARAYYQDATNRTLNEFI